MDWANDGFNFIAKFLTLVVGDVTAALTILADPEDILDAVDPAAANVEEIRNQ